MQVASAQEIKLHTKVEDIDAALEKEWPTTEDSPSFWNSMTGEAYDQYALAKGWTQPQNMVDRLIGPGQIVDLDPANAQILDVGAGTGAVGKFLSKKGYGGIVGIDASSNLIEKQKEIEAYKESRCMYVGMGVENFPDDLKNRFDLVTAAGVWRDGHIPASGLDDAFAALKVGGYLVSTVRDYIWVKGEKGGYKDLIDKYIEEGRMELIHTQTWTQGTGLNDGPWAEVAIIGSVIRRTK